MKDIDRCFIGSSYPQSGRHYSDVERAERDKHLFIYRFNQGKETVRRDNRAKPYPTLAGIQSCYQTSKYQNESFRDIGLGDLVMTGKEKWRKILSTMELDPFTKSWISRGLREIHHVNDNMDGRMDACLGYSAILGAKSFQAVEELRGEFAEDRKKRSLDGWERMNVKRSLEDSLCTGGEGLWKQMDTCPEH